MKKIILTYCIICNIKCFAQLSKDTSIIQVHYNYTSIIDTVSMQKNIDEPMILEIGSRFTKYYSLNKKIGDSLFKNDVMNEQTFDPSKLSELRSHPKYFQNKSSTIIFQNNPSYKITQVSKIIKDYTFTENLNLMKWELQSDTCRILGYVCQKAMTFFRGRHYEAWFAQNIPYSYGPWKFNGLPGLILKISDTRKNFIFECFQIKNISTLIEYDLKKCIQTTRQDFTRLNKIYREDPQQLLLNNGVRIISIKEADGSDANINKTYPKRPYNPIELTYD